MTTTLPAECFLTFASIVYADGQIRRGELEGFRRAARSYGVTEAELTAIQEQAQQGLKLKDIKLPELSDWQKALTFAFAVWIAKVDGIINKEESQMLQALSDQLGLDKLRRDAARSATYDIAALPGGHKPDIFDFEALERQLEKKLPGSFKRHHGTHEESVEESVEELDEELDLVQD